MHSDTHFAQLLASRLCHDLIGPAGALGNGVDLLKELGPDAEVIALIEDGANRVVRQLNYFRVAFGLRGGDGTFNGWGEAQSLATDLLTGSRVALDWPETGAANTLAEPVPAAAVRLVLCLVLIASEALPRTGTVRVRTGNAAAVPISVAAKGDRLVMDDAAAAALAGANSAEARTAHAALAARLAQSLGTQIAVERPHANELRLVASIAQ